MKNYLLLMIGAVLGSSLRFYLSSLSFTLFQGSELFLIAFINVAGCAFIGVLSSFSLSSEWQLFTTVGFLGSFTTFSGFCLGFFNLTKQSALLGTAYFLVSIGGGFAIFWITRWLTLRWVL